MVRQFKLINAKGQTHDMMDRSAFFYSPDGLGFKMNAEFFQIGNAYQLIDTEAAQKAPAGIMVFSTYAAYRAFAAFVSFTPLKLAYKPQASDDWYYLDCIVSSLSKAEFDRQDHRLKCNIDFQGTSKWYVPRIAQRSGVEVANAKQYTYTYNYQYADAITGIIEITNNSAVDAPAIITIMGEITDPAWTLIVNNQTIQSGSISGTIEAGHKLVINSKDNSLEIGEYDATTNEFIANRYQDSDFNLQNFIYVPNGVSTLRVSGSVLDSIDAWVEIEELHETV